MTTLKDAIGDVIPLAIKTGLLYLVIIAPFKWEKELGGILDKAQTMLRGAAATTGGFLLGAAPYAFKKKMDVAGAKKAGEDIEKWKATDPQRYQQEMSKMKTKRAEDYVKQQVMTDHNLTDDQYKKLDAQTKQQYADQVTNPMGGIQGIERMLDSRIEDNAKEEAKKLPSSITKAEKQAYIKAQVDKVNGQDLKAIIAKGYEGKIIPISGGLNLFGKKIIPQLEANVGQRAPLLGTAVDETMKALQKYNPMGVVSAWKERMDLNAKNIEKAHFRSSKITELALGPEAALKHQQAIQKDDLSHIYTLDGMRGSAYWKQYNKAVQNLARDLGIGTKEAGEYFRKELRRMQEDQSSKTEYLRYLGGLGLDPSGMAAIMEGYDRASTLIAQEARSTRSREHIQMTAQTAETSWHDVQPGPPAPPTALQIYVGNLSGQTANSPGFDATNVNMPYNVQNTTTDDFAALVTQRDIIMDQIKSALSQQGLQPGEQQIVVQALRDANGSALPASIVQTIGQDQNLKNLTSQFQAIRATELSAIQSTSAGSDILYKTMVDAITTKMISPEQIRQAIEQFRNQNAAPDVIEKAKREIAKAIKQNPQMINNHVADLVDRGLQIITTQ